MKLAVLLTVAVLGVSAGEASAATWKITSPGGGLAGALDGVSGVSSSWCMAVGSEIDNPDFGSIGQSGYTDAAFAILWNANSWTSEMIPVAVGDASAYLDSVSCASERFCVAVGSAYDAGELSPFVQLWNGSTWTQEASGVPSKGQLTAVSCVSTSFCMAVGVGVSRPVTVGWNGKRWRSEPTPRAGPDNLGALYAVSCTHANDCTAVGNYELDENDDPSGTLAEHWNSERWATRGKLGPTNYGFLTSVSAYQMRSAWPSAPRASNRPCLAPRSRRSGTERRGVTSPAHVSADPAGRCSGSRVSRGATASPSGTEPLARRPRTTNRSAGS
jgi:hypothetical protein